MRHWFPPLWRLGPPDPTGYPSREESPYRLPWEAGEVRFCVQGNRGIVSHRGPEQFAYDFALPLGTPVCAARGGRVFHVDLSHDGRGFSAPNNLLGIDHGDGTIGWYVHLLKGGSSLDVGEEVVQGQVIAVSGNVGRSLLPHLHFEVTGGDGVTIPVTFAEVFTDRGIPRMFKRYTSGNARS
jgi:murein DD-endopeptidase MepM/ murein hydrolase activator NlpD